MAVETRLRPAPSVEAVQDCPEPRPAGPYRFSVDEYYRMAEEGIVPPDARVELIEGAILHMSPIGAKHAACVRKLYRVLDRQLDDSAIINPQNPLRLTDDSEPEPDVAVIRNGLEDRHPTSSDVFLVIEVADTSLSFDRDTKVPLYAASGIPEVWLVDLNGKTVTRYTKPNAGAYDLQERFRRGDTLTISALPGVTVAVGDMLPSPEAAAPPEPTTQAEQARQEDPAGG